MNYSTTPELGLVRAFYPGTGYADARSRSRLSREIASYDGRIKEYFTMGELKECSVSEGWVGNVGQAVAC
jgi:hypothetical protein